MDEEGNGKLIDFGTIVKLNFTLESKDGYRSFNSKVQNENDIVKEFWGYKEENVGRGKEIDFREFDKVFEKFVKASVDFKKNNKGKEEECYERIFSKWKGLIKGRGKNKKESDKKLRKTLFIVEYCYLGRKKKRQKKKRRNMKEEDGNNNEGNESYNSEHRMKTIIDNEENINLNTENSSHS